MITFPYGYAADSRGILGMGTMLTWDQMVTKTTVNRLHPEVQRRFKALIAHAQKQGVPLGPGTGWRVQPVNKPGFAQPGNSWHESTPVNPASATAFAIDTVPNISWNWMEANCARFGFRSFRAVNEEPWHIQPIEIPAGRSWATTPPKVQRFNLPGQPTVVVPRPVLRRGNESRQVRMLIDALKFWKWYPDRWMADTNNGQFGLRTENGVKEMQRALKQTVDGVYGVRTAAAYKRFLEAMAKL